MKEKYISTRGGESGLSASQAIIKGLSTDGGLFVPSNLHNLHLTSEDLKDANCYSDYAKKVFSLFLDDFSDDQLDYCIHNAYATGKFDTEEPVSIAKVSDRYFLELFHGPTSAFKDMALTILPLLMTTALENTSKKAHIIILTATSGDTGKAALEGFKDVDDISIFVFYPKEGVSAIQEKQMLVQEGRNTYVISVIGNFDDAQNGVKEILSDEKLRMELEKKNLHFSSANSINIGRLLPQIVYYYYSYYQLVTNKEICNGEPVNFAVPTGNFGNILAGYYAKCLGLPINRFICASNTNNVLTDFIKTGTYDRNRKFYKTTSPSMDILISSNLERLLYDLSGENSETIKHLMKGLNEKGVYTVDASIRKKIASEFYGGYADENKTKATIKKTYEECGYLMDPHTAVANAVYDDYLIKTGDTTKTVILSTASPYKFSETVYLSLFGESNIIENPYELLEELSRKTNLEIPNPLKDLDKKHNCHNTVVSKEEMKKSILNILKDGDIDVKS